MSAVEVAAGLRRWAKGSYPHEAAVELMIRAVDGRFLFGPWVVVEGDDAPAPAWRWVDVDRIDVEAGPWSGGERRLLRVVASLLGGPAVRLDDVVSGLDRGNLAFVLAALAHCNGSHEHRAPAVWEYPGDVDPRPSEAEWAAAHPDEPMPLWTPPRPQMVHPGGEPLGPLLAWPGDDEPSPIAESLSTGDYS